MKTGNYYPHLNEFNSIIIIDLMKKEITKKGGQLIKVDYPEKYIIEAHQNTFNGIYEKVENDLNGYICDGSCIGPDMYIQFIFNNKYYSFDIDKNPFFEFWYSKYQVEKIDNNTYKNDYSHYLEDSKKYLSVDFDILWKVNTLEELQQVAKNILEQLLNNLPDSTIETTRKRVYNLYNNGYHYETIKEKRKSIYKVQD